MFAIDTLEMSPKQTRCGFYVEIRVFCHVIQGRGVPDPRLCFKEDGILSCGYSDQLVDSKHIRRADARNPIAIAIEIDDEADNEQRRYTGKRVDVRKRV